ncbi:hypothetical protein LCGC14_2212870 [marine sediment metagenome]|uniref:Uncharacterized protein n=1 Tax=marine sediment metagenome TaxID=412755 RepID=A0A0F9FQS7_9ZZZZ
MTKAYTPREYWDARLRAHWDLSGVGRGDYGVAYNRWIYRAQDRAVRRAFHHCSVDVSGKRVLDVGSGTGYWLGDDGGTPKFSIGNSAGNKLTWDGSTLAITGGFDIQNTSGSFNPTWNSGTWSPDTDPSGTIHYLDLGKIVFMWATAGISKTSASTDLIINNVPAAIRPVGNQNAFITDCQDNGVQTSCQATVYSSGLMSFDIITAGHAYNSVGWTASGTKGLGVWSLMYTK